jgi:hypothetical protein
MIITINDTEYNKLYEAGNLDKETIIDTIVKAGVQIKSELVFVTTDRIHWI